MGLSRRMPVFRIALSMTEGQLLTATCSHRWLPFDAPPFSNLGIVPINVIVGANGTGKTHLMKVAYAACDVSKTRANFAEKLVRLFLPSGRALGRLVRRQQGSSRCSLEVYRGGVKLRASFSNCPVTE